MLGIVLVTLGVVLILISFTALHWYAASSQVDSAGDAGFADLHRLATVSGRGLARAYFGWFAWLLILAVIVLGFLANVPSAAALWLRVAGVLLGLAGAGATYAALHGVVPGGNVFHNADAGIWLAMIGYVIAGAGAAVGPPRTSQPPEDAATPDTPTPGAPAPRRPRPF